MIVSNKSIVDVLFNHQYGRCYYCKKRMILDERQHKDSATLDHKIPTSRGGSESIKNKCCCCLDCNYRKSDLTEEEFLGQTINPPLTIFYDPYKRARRTILFKKQEGKCKKCHCLMTKTSRIISTTAMIQLYDPYGPDTFTNSYLECYRCQTDQL